MRISSPTPVPAIGARSVALRRSSVRNASRSFAVTFGAVVIVAIFLSPLFRSATQALKTPQQAAQIGGPILPSSPALYNYQGQELDVLTVPLPDGTTKDLAILKKGRQESTFVDPSNEAAEPIVWQGAWRTLEPVWVVSPTWDNFGDVWRLIDYPRLLFNTVAIAVLGTIGTLISCVLVAYGFSRFRFPGRGLLFTLMIATIFLPTAVTIIPTYIIFLKLGWIGSWLPLIVPAFFANAYDVFLLRQYFMTIPRDLDEAAMMDGAGPLRTLTSVILPQAWPAVIAVAIFHLVYSWNDFFGPLIYLSTVPELQPLAVGLQRFNGIYYTRPGLVQAATLMTLIIPVVIFLFSQRVFMRGIVITGVEK
jgi:multiple sugar transport system permease protein